MISKMCVFLCFGGSGWFRKGRKAGRNDFHLSGKKLDVLIGFNRFTYVVYMFLIGFLTPKNLP